MNKLIALILLIFTNQAFSQIPTLVPSPKQARENVEAEAYEANYEDQKQLISCWFKTKERKDNQYKLSIKTTGQNDLFIEIGRKYTTTQVTEYMGVTSTVIERHFETTKHASDYSDFLNNFVEGFIEKGKSELQLNACTYDLTTWSKPIDGQINQDLTINFKATTRKRSKMGQFFAFIGVSVTEFPNIASQSYRFMNEADSFWQSAKFLYINNPAQALAAAAYAEELGGEVTIGNKSYQLSSCSADDVLAHYAK